jgi:hypothetical protein
MITGAATAPDFTFETTVAATSSALLIAFVALRWATTSERAKPPRRLQLRRIELLVTAISLTATALVVYISLDSLAASEALGRQDRATCVRLLAVSVGTFALAALVDRVSSYSAADSAPWDFLHETRAFRVFAATYAVLCCMVIGLGSSPPTGCSQSPWVCW